MDHTARLSNEPDFVLQTVTPTIPLVLTTTLSETLLDKKMTTDPTKSSPPVEATANQLENPQNEGEQQTTAHMQGWALASLTIAFMAICFVLALDNTILATAIPQITSDFHSLNDIGWYGSSYLIAQMAMLPTCGRLYAFYNIKWVYCTSLVVFELASVISAVAPNSITLIVGRAISGVGAAGLVSGTTTILSYCVPLKKQAKLSPVILGLYSTGSAIGPLVGGAITDSKTLTWRFIFWLNLPFGAVGLALIWFSLRNPPPAVKEGLPWQDKLRQLDMLGALILLGATSCLNLALQWGGIVHPWSDPKVFGCLIGFGLLLLCFVGLQARGKETATVPLRILRGRTVVASCGFMMLVQVAIVLNSYYWPIYFHLGTICAGWISSRFGHYVPLMWIGAPIQAIGGGLYQLINPHSPRGQWIGTQIASGVGYGMCSQMPILAVQVVLKKADMSTGLVIIMFFQMLGGALAPSIGQNLFTDALLPRLTRVDGIDAAAVVEVGAGEFRKIVPPQVLDAVVEAFNSALKNVFLGCSCYPSPSLVAEEFSLDSGYVSESPVGKLGTLRMIHNDESPPLTAAVGVLFEDGFVRRNPSAPATYHPSQECKSIVNSQSEGYCVMGAKDPGYTMEDPDNVWMNYTVNDDSVEVCFVSPRKGAERFQAALDRASDIIVIMMFLYKMNHDVIMCKMFDTEMLSPKRQCYWRRNPTAADRVI
ncbi:MFS transporter [Colletotrichum lupini]|uniref:MFS transporter n=1 Tax=Colletotrichum lupini TaxID=145971 RepID=A0A9Q8WAY6_9PEZI|nr:MFS transporter [Colletotrichum lupini]UQC76536.1 MFS transporter [Colletotrichum lupini]